MGSPQTEPAQPDIEAEIDAAIATCGGDLRATIRALLVANTFLAGELEVLLSQASSGYGRGRIRRSRLAEDREL